MDSMDIHDVMTDEDEDVVPKSADTSAMDTDIERDMQRLDDDEDEEDEDVGMTEEDDEDDDESGVKPAAARANKSPNKAKKKASRNTDDEGDDDEEDDEMKDDTADEEDEEPDEEEDEEEEEDEDKQEEEDDSRAADQSKIDASDPKSMLRMIRSLPEEEARRHEQFRRSHFDRGAIKRIMAKAIQDCLTPDKKVPVVTQVMAIVMAGMTKVFVGELTAEARRIMERNGETGPMEPRHLREAQRLYYKRRPLARGRNLRRLLR